MVRMLRYFGIMVACIATSVSAESLPIIRAHPYTLGESPAPAQQRLIESWSQCGIGTTLTKYAGMRSWVSAKASRTVVIEADVDTNALLLRCRYGFTCDATLVVETQSCGSESAPNTASYSVGPFAKIFFSEVVLEPPTRKAPIGSDPSKQKRIVDYDDFNPFTTCESYLSADAEKATPSVVVPSDADSQCQIGALMLGLLTAPQTASPGYACCSLTPTAGE